jgi:hypothetical protein
MAFSTHYTLSRNNNVSFIDYERSQLVERFCEDPKWVL